MMNNKSQSTEIIQGALIRLQQYNIIRSMIIIVKIAMETKNLNRKVQEGKT